MKPYNSAEAHAPLVLAHGLFGFDRIGLGPLTIAPYFRGIVEDFRAQGYRVLVPRVHPTAGIARRARQLGAQIKAAFGDEPVHLLGHSMGGLDARQLLTDPRWARRVLTVTTLGSPHKGSALAELVDPRLGPVYGLLRAVRWDHDGLLELLPERAIRWHEATPCPEGVACYSVGGNPDNDDVCWPLKWSHAALTEVVGPNDGLVGLDSALAFGTPLPPWPVDHLRMMNWFTRPRRATWRRVIRLYHRILRTIAQHDPAAHALTTA